jgi:hypothetical protein
VTPTQKSILIALAVAAITSVAETAEKIVPEQAGTEWAFAVKVLGYAAAAARLYLMQSKPQEPKE